MVFFMPKMGLGMQLGVRLGVHLGGCKNEIFWLGVHLGVHF